MRTMMQSVSLAMLAMSAGVFLVVQATLNARLRELLSSWSWTGLVSYLGGTLTMTLVLLIQRQPLPNPASGVPWWSWFGGFFGAAYLVLAILSVPRLGAASTIALVIAGQMLASLTFDHFGLLGLARHAATPARAIAALLLIVAVVLMRF